MNYIAEIKAFHDLVQIKQLSTGQIALWYALMYINNKCAWTEWFTVPNLTLELNTGLSRSGIAKARNVLKQYNIIDFKANGTKATSYKLVTLLNSMQVGSQDGNQNNNSIAKSNQVSTQDSKQVSNQNSVQSSNQSSTQNRAPLNKLNKTKQYNTTTTNIKSTNYIDNGDKLCQNDSSSFSQEEFKDIVKLYSENIELPNQLTSDWIIDTLNDYGFIWFKNAIIIANQNGKRKQSYIKGILDNWKTNGGMRLEKDKTAAKDESIQGVYSSEELDRIEKLMEKKMWEKQNSG